MIAAAPQPAPRAPAPAAPTPAAQAAPAPARSVEFARPRFSFARQPVWPVQAKLELGRPGDAWEREADRVADLVVGMDSVPEGAPPLSVTRAGAGAGVVAREETPEEDDEEYRSGSHPSRLSAKEVPGAIPSIPAGVAAEIAALPGGGQPLAPEVRAFVEPRFGYDFGRVRVHTDARAARTTRAVGARAYAVGRDVVFAPGEYRPDTAAGRRLLAHELTHVVQQGEQPRAVMRACSCAAIPGARNPTPAEAATMPADFPRLVSGNWCITAPPTPTYNCYAWSVGISSRWVETEVDTAGNGNGTLEFSDFDAFYARFGLRPILACDPAAQVALYAKGSAPQHAARRHTASCGYAFESKLGKDFRMVHDVYELEGPLYGNLARFYVPQ